ncbi:hypothetical protein [Sphingomonas jatrophae]|uniref:Uncharacterized protein n=1 Tax=Sphingomonas jatrophae TaxID=1166337 RepID=A0A1I6JKA9_9SPHN|nr:hypothetical protein [Sphingomonas jatrophae]SFR79393.1 hypothetical protein SAMN05192580_0390 [Sphingomonas jatrophae]
MDHAQPHFAPLTATMIRRPAVAISVPMDAAIMIPPARALVPVIAEPFLSPSDIRLFIMTYVIGLILFLSWLA